MKIENIEQAEKQLQKYVPNVSKLTGDNMSVDRISHLMSLIGNPQDALKIIHVAGTSGKTSTSYYIASILQQSGKKTALTVSPHINSVTERLQINGKNLSDEKFCNYLADLVQIIEDSKLELSYFEVLIALAFWVSEKEHIDYLVLETGMGGLHDASNVANREEKVCVITDIGFDHMHILGNTLSEIALQKAGIIHHHNTVFAYEQSDEINTVLLGVSANKNAHINLLNEEILKNNTKLKLKNSPKYQSRNWLLAEQVCAFIAERDNFIMSLPDTDLVIVPARMEFSSINGKKILLDGAHNQQKMHTFVSSYKDKYKQAKACILIALKEGKEYKDVITELKPITEYLIVTKFNTSQDLPAVSEEPYKLKDYALSIGINAVAIESLEEAVDTLVKDENEQKIITGSFYLISQVNSTTKTS